MKKIFILLCGVSLLLVSCNHKPKAPTGKVEEIIPAEYLNKPAEMTFEEDSWDFGEIAEGEKAEHTFAFTNTGKNPLLIVKGFGSCGCTVPDYPKEPIAAGEKSEIHVVFNSKGKEGKQIKKVILIANTEPNKTELLVTGNVKKE